uniref:Uncharacterized protein n=1 Tax=Anguilla anguilla TaxID=7936 RepID=A0A0E9SXX8_ANGAN
MDLMSRSSVNIGGLKHAC